MTERRDLDLLVFELARSHERALARNAEQLAASERRFLDALEQQAALSRAQGRRPTWGLSSRGLALAVGGAALVVAAVVGFGLGVLPFELRRAPTSASFEVLPEPAIPRASTRAAHAAMPPRSDPCTRSMRAAGTDPLIDDFEDGDGLISPREGRSGAWALYKDNEPAGGLPSLTPVRRSPATARNRKALHATGGELRDWGASVQFDLRPSCYDASAYAGIAFSARGPGRVYLAVREMRVVPVAWGGTCTEGCYNVHQKKIDLTATWQSFTVPWSELRQRGYETAPLDPTHIHDIAFMVQAADTPFDLWIDDVSFVPRHVPSPSSQAGGTMP